MPPVLRKTLPLATLALAGLVAALVLPSVKDPSEPPAIASALSAASKPAGRVKGLVPDQSAIRHLPRPDPRRRWNVILIVVDSLRADRMGWTGYHRRLTPNLDRLAQRSAVFTRAYAASNRTSFSLAALLTGRYPSEIRRTFGYFIRLLPGNVPVASCFQQAGYQTLGSTSHFCFNLKFKMHRGFDVWQVYAHNDRRIMNNLPTAPKITDRAVQLLKGPARRQRRWGQAGPVAESGPTRPFFLFLHYLDPHLYYLRHQQFPPPGKRVVDRYDAEVKFLDHHLGRLFSFLEESGLNKDTVIVLTSDHGEAFGEHGLYAHGVSLYEHQIRVPLLVHVPSLPPRRVERRVSFMDLPRTLLDLAGIPVPAGYQGKSLVPELRWGLPMPPTPIYTEVVDGPYHLENRALILGDWKLHHWPRKGTFELYDLRADPGETRDLMGKRPQMAQFMRTYYQAYREVLLDPIPALKLR